MYFPYVRGKMFDLLALRESALTIVNSGKILPIIEPVKSGNSINVSFNKFKEYNMPFIFITNPFCGDLVYKKNVLNEFIENTIYDYENCYFAYYIKSEDYNNNNYIQDFLKKYKQKKVCFIHSGESLDYKRFDNLTKDYSNIDFNILYKANTRRGYQNHFKKDTTVILEDGFNKEKRNADYNEESFFSELFRTYCDDGYKGFGDFSIVGDDYLEGIAIAYAVAIHYIYYNAQDDCLMVKHFVSDRTNDNQDIAGKFLEANTKLYNFINDFAQEKHMTPASQEFISLYNSEHYPGLGAIKKLSIRHHIELMASLI